MDVPFLSVIPNTLYEMTILCPNVVDTRIVNVLSAGVLNEENHHSPVSCIVPIYSYTDR